MEAPPPRASTAVVPVPLEQPRADELIDLQVHPSGIVPVLQNVVSTVNVGCKLDLRNIALHARNAEYNPKRFAAVIMRIREPKTTALIFASGKMVCTGAKSEEDSRMAARRYAGIIKKLGFPAVFKEFKIQNIVGSCDVKFPIRLEGLAYSQGLFSSYEPELFPGLIYRMKVPKIVLLIFVSGKVVLTGAKRREEIYEAFENIYPILRDFRKGDATPLPPMPGASSMLPPGASPALALTAATPGGPQASGAAGNEDARRSMLPPPSPYHHNLPPPTPAHHHAGGLPPPTPSHHAGLPPPTPMHHHAGGLPPPTPARTGSTALASQSSATLLPHAAWAQLPPPAPLPQQQQHRELPPATPHHNGGLMLPPPSPAHNAFNAPRH